MKIVLSTFFLYVSLSVSATDPRYSVVAIPAELKEGANAVIREYNETFTIISKNRSNRRVFEAITILNDKGKDFAIEVVLYDKLSKVTTFKGVVYDVNGKEVKKLKGSEIYDQSAVSGDLFQDDRLKAADLTYGSYPYTVQFEYEVEYKSLFQIYPFYLIDEEKVSVQSSSYSLVYDPALSPRFKTVNIEKQPEKLFIDGKESLTWKFENVKPIKNEPFGPSIRAVTSSIRVAPTSFEYDGYAGSMSTWDEFGDWIRKLNEGRNVLPEQTKQKIKEITSGLTSVEEKAKACYEYLQSKTRYVSVQLGIGGYQPFEASLVDKTGYGDCKALSNYMNAILNEAGVKSYYALIRAGENEPDIHRDFPASQFNHVIVAVPNGKDTLWLECTDQTNPFGYIGSFTNDRTALLVSQSGAALVRTPDYKYDVNVQSRSADVHLDVAGDAKAKIKTAYSGLQYGNGSLDRFLNNQYDDQKKWVLNNTDIPSFDLNNFVFTNIKDKVPSAIVELDLTLKRLAAVSGKRLFLTPNLMNRSTLIPEKVENRKTDVIRKVGYTDLDTIRYHLPENIYPEFLPEPVKIKSRFGEYESSYTFDQGVVIYTRKIKVVKGRFPPESYQELTDFYRSINKADNMKLVFLNKT